MFSWDIDYDPPGRLIDWNGQEWIQDKDKKDQKKAAHPNFRFRERVKYCSCISSEWENPNGVPVSAILFGGRRPSTNQ
jgi:phosphoenolpyruvate carboxykinase (GTP)